MGVGNDADSKEEPEATQTEEGAERLSLKDQCGQFALSVSRHGASWWMPLLLLGVVVVNTLTAGTLMWCFGVLQASLFAIIVMARKYTFWLGPFILALGSLIGGSTYIGIINTVGVDALLEQTGAANSTMLQTAQGYAQDYGVIGLLGLQLAPIPTPTAVLCAVGTIAGIPKWTILTTLTTSKFLQLVVSAIVLKVFTSGMTPEEYIQKSLNGDMSTGNLVEALKKQMEQAQENVDNEQKEEVEDKKNM